MKPKKPSRRQQGLNLIKFAGYHNRPYQLICIDYRISYEAARPVWNQGHRAREAGVKCGCMDCNKDRT